MKQRLSTDGSTIYSMRWKVSDTPAGRQFCQLVASARRTLENVCFSVLSGWPTPTMTDANRGEKYNTFAQNKTLNMATQLAAWPTPLARDGDKLDATPKAIERRMELGREIGVAMVARMTSLEGWSNHPGEVRITHSGQILTGLDAAMASSGRLNPAHSRWLMGYPPEWDDCAVMAMPSSRKSQQSSSKLSSHQLQNQEN
nr:hypothetical protein [Swingsia samuiensis]